MSVNGRIKAILIQRYKRAAQNVLLYLTYNRDPDVSDNFGTTLLHMVASASLDNLTIVQYLLDMGANINVQDNDGATPLHLAVSRTNFKIADFLLARGAAVNIQEKNGKTALHLLIDGIWLLKNEQEKRENSLRLVQKLLQCGADPNLQDVYGESPLMRAVRQNDFDVVKQVLMFGGNVHLRNIDSDTCLHVLSWSFEPNKDILVELVKHGACVNCIGSRGQSVLDLMFQHYEAEGLETVKLLIRTATLVNWENKICFELGTNSELYCLEEFIDSCYAEVSRMKACTYSDKSNLCHFALNGGNASQKDESSGESIFDQVLETLMQDDFPIYQDFIRPYFERTFLSQKSLIMRMYTRNGMEKKVVYLNSDITFEIAPYLSDEDLLNIIIVYSKPDVY